jgi:hypothetical protein
MSDNIITALKTFKLDAVAIPETFYTDFDPKLIKGKTAEWIRKEDSQLMLHLQHAKTRTASLNAIGMWL